MAKRRALPSANRPPPADNSSRLLAALPSADYTRIRPSLAIVPLTLKDILHKPGEPIREVYFLGGGFCSMLSVLEDASCECYRAATDLLKRVTDGRKS